MANTLTGRVLHIYPTQQIPSKDGSKNILKRGIVIDCTRFDPWTGERSGFENTPLLEFTGDRCAELDKYHKGDIVTITFDVQGTRYRNRDGVEQIFTRVQPYRIELRQGKQATMQTGGTPMQAQQPVYQQQPPNFPPPAGDVPF